MSWTLGAHALVARPAAITTKLRSAESEPAANASPIADGASCQLLSESENRQMSELLNKQAEFLLCDEPSDDPSITCFLKPESWDKEISSGEKDYICMRDDHASVTTTKGLTSEDSY